MTEELEICTLDRKPKRAKVPKGIIPHKEMCPAAKKAGTAQLVRPAQSWELTNPDKVMLEITENHDWLNDFTLSDKSDSDDDCQAVPDQPFKILSTSPVLKATGRYQSGQIPRDTNESM